MIFRIAVSNHLVWLISAGRPIPTDYVLSSDIVSPFLHRAGLEPAPPKRVGLESTALDHSANDVLSFSFLYRKFNLYYFLKVFIKSEFLELL